MINVDIITLKKSKFTNLGKLGTTKLGSFPNCFG